jgi:hypothetical protein
MGVSVSSTLAQRGGAGAFANVLASAVPSGGENVTPKVDAKTDERKPMDRLAELLKRILRVPKEEATKQR